jgi:hypothetical protein
MMHALKRVLFTILAGLSLLLFLAVVGVWIWSFFYRDIVSYVSGNGNGQIIQSIQGRLHIMSNLGGNSSGSFSHQEDRLAPNAIWNGGMSSYPVQVQWHFGHVWQTYSRFHMTFAASRASAPPGFTTNHRLIVIPYWSPALLFSILPALWTWRFIKYGHRRKAGHCPKCNYDLRATPDRCPECGWTPAGL